MYATKIEEATLAIEEHNKHASTKIDTAEFLKKLQDLGGTTTEALAQVSWENLESIGLPVLLAKQVTAIFRKTDVKNEGLKVFSQRQAERMTPEDLLRNYDPRKPNSPVGEQLKKESGGKRCLVFNADRTVNIQASLVLLDELAEAFPEREYVHVDGRPFLTYAVGEMPGKMVPENPLYPGKALLPHEVCGQTNRSWAGVPDTVRQILYLAVKETHELVIDLEKANDVLDKVVSGNAESMLHSRYPRATILRDEYEKSGKLPSLLVEVGASAGSRKNDPFATGKGNRVV